MFALEALDAAKEAGTLTAESTLAEFGELPTADEIAAVVEAAKEAQSKYCIPGDITGTGEVDEDDVDAFIEELLDGELPTDPTDPEFARYDVNGDGRVDIADAQAILNLSLGLNWDGSEPDDETAGVRAYSTLDMDATLTAAAVRLAKGVTRYVISLEGDLRYAGFQMDVEGDVVGANGNNVLSRKNGRVHRIVSMGAGGNGEVLTVDVKGEARFGNICFTTNRAQGVYLELSGMATGIDGISAAQQLGAAVYSLGGAQLGSARRGVNIVREANGNVRKVLVK